MPVHLIQRLLPKSKGSWRWIFISYAHFIPWIFLIVILFLHFSIDIFSFLFKKFIFHLYMSFINLRRVHLTGPDNELIFIHREPLILIWPSSILAISINLNYILIILLDFFSSFFLLSFLLFLLLMLILSFIIIVFFQNFLFFLLFQVIILNYYFSSRKYPMLPLLLLLLLPSFNNMPEKLVFVGTHHIPRDVLPASIGP